MFFKKRSKSLFVILLILVLMNSAPPLGAYALEQEQVQAEQALLVYDSLAVGTPREGNLEMLQRLLAAFNLQVKIISSDAYKQGSLETVSKLIFVRNQPELHLTNEAYLADFNDYTGSYLHIGSDVPPKVKAKLEISENGQIGSYGKAVAKLAYAPVLDPSEADALALGRLLRTWLGAVDRPNSYVLFKEIYPFSDLSLLMKLSERLYAAGIPFMASVRPVFSNLDYPAMKRYTEALKYVQARGGSILIHAPVVASTISRDEHELQEKMSLFIDKLAAEEIAPLGVVTELYWSYDRVYAAEGMSLFDSAVLLPDEKRMHRSQTNVSKPFLSSLFALHAGEWINEDQANKRYDSFPVDTALIFPFSDHAEELDEYVQKLKDSWMLFADYKMAPHRIQTAATTITSREGVLQINGQTVSLSAGQSTEDGSYTYKPETPQSLTKLFQVQNNIFIVIIVLSLLIFGLLTRMGYKLYKRKYYK